MTINVGVHDDGKPADTLKRFPLHRNSRRFITPKDSRPSEILDRFANLALPDFAAGITPWISFKPNPVDVASGTWSAALRGLADWVRAAEADGNHMRVVIWHEPENDMVGKTFADMFNKARETMKNVYPDIVCVYSALSYRWDPRVITQPGKGQTVDPSGWQRTVADIYACDVYSGGSAASAGAILPEHPGFVRWRQYIRPTGQYALSERGWDRGPRRAETITREAEWLAGTIDGALCTDYLAWNTVDDKGHWKLDDDPASLKALNNAFDLLTTPPPPPPPEFLVLDADLDIDVHAATGILVHGNRRDEFRTFYARVTGVES